jgi:hypothetical protein
VISGLPAIEQNLSTNQMQQIYMGQEAQSIETDLMINSYKKMATGPAAKLISDNLPSPQDTNAEAFAAFDDLEKRFKKIIEESKDKKKSFIIKTALTGIKLLMTGQNIPTHSISKPEEYATFAVPGMPNIRQLFVLAYKLLNNNIKDNIKNVLTEILVNPQRWNIFKEAFSNNKSNIQGFVKESSSIGELLKNHEKDILAFFANGIEIPDTFLIDKDQMQILTKLNRQITEINKDGLNPIIEALFMIMRGHNEDLENPNAQNKTACARGAYLSIMKIFAEINATKDAMQGIQKVVIKKCTE